MQGRIIKGIGGFYYVHTKEGIITCKARGVFRKDGKKPLVGDIVTVDLLDGEENTGSITEILPRGNTIIRPNVANIDQALIIFALKSPDPNFVTLDKMIIQYKAQNVPVVLCFNKEDLINSKECQNILDDYKNSGCSIYVTSAADGDGIENLYNALKHKTTAVAGPSGVGKSSIINSLSNKSVMETGEISEKLARGKHTTRHSEIIPLDEDTFIMDTPGFGSFDLFDVESDELAQYYDEFIDLNACRFAPCSHTHEPGCIVKDNVDAGLISANRYSNYVHIYEELVKKSRRY